MPSAKIMSWNVQKLGEDKVYSTAFIHFLAHVIAWRQADVVALMEVVGNMGDSLVERLVPVLDGIDPRITATNNVRWRGVSSEITPDSLREQYVYLWRDEQNVLTADPVDFSLEGIVKDDDFRGVFANLASGARKAAQKQLVDVVYQAEYLNATYRVPRDKEAGLRDQTQPFAIGGNPTNAQLAEIRRVLTASLAPYFPRMWDRPPFTGIFTLGGSTLLTTAVLHSPFNLHKYQAANNLALLNRVNASANALIMGDLNVAGDRRRGPADGELQRIARRVGTDRVAVRANGRVVYVRVFETLEELHYERAVDDRTSLVETAPLLASFDQCRSSEYDKFFVRRVPNQSVVGYQAPAVPIVVDVLSALTAPGDISTQARSVYQAYTTRRSAEIQRRLDDIQQQITWVEARLQAGGLDARRTQRLQQEKRKLQQRLAEVRAKRPNWRPFPCSSYEGAHDVYRSSISDHLPIEAVVSYPNPA